MLRATATTLMFAADYAEITLYAMMLIRHAYYVYAMLMLSPL